MSAFAKFMLKQSARTIPSVIAKEESHYHLALSSSEYIPMVLSLFLSFSSKSSEKMMKNHFLNGKITLKKYLFHVQHFLIQLHFCLCGPGISRDAYWKLTWGERQILTLIYLTLESLPEVSVFIFASLYVLLSIR